MSLSIRSAPVDSRLFSSEIQNPEINFKGYMTWLLITSQALSLNTLCLVHSAPLTLAFSFFLEHVWHPPFALCSLHLEHSSPRHLRIPHHLCLQIFTWKCSEWNTHTCSVPSPLTFLHKIHYQESYKYFHSLSYYLSLSVEWKSQKCRNFLFFSHCCVLRTKNDD